MRAHARHRRSVGRARPRRVLTILRTSAHPCPRPDQALRRLHRGGRHRLRRRARRIVRIPRTERRRQDLDDADDRLRLADDGGPALGHGHGPEHRRPADPRADRGGPAAGHARHRADRPREPADLRALLRPRLEGDRPASRRAHRVRPADRARQRRGRAALGRHEAPPDDRPGAHQRAQPAAPRRADHRPRPAGAAPPLGPAVPAQAARRDAGPDDPLHGRGRAALRPPGRDGQGEDRRRGQPAVADRAVLDPRGHGAPLRAGRRGDARRQARWHRPADRAPRGPGPAVHR